MINRLLLLLIAFLVVATGAQAQTNPLGAGYSFANGQLYVQISPSLQSLTLPFSISVNIKAPTIPPGGVTSALVSSMPSLGTSGGFFVGYNTGAASTFNLMSYIQPGTALGGGFSCTHQGQICWRYPFVDDGNLHNVCVRWTPTQGFLYLDGIVRDQTSVVGAYSSTPDLYWLLGNNYPSNATMYDVRAYNGDIGAAGCVQLANNALAGVYPTTGTLSTGMVLHLPMDSTAGPCTNVSTAWTCPDVSGHSNTAVNGALSPTVAITTPCVSSCTVSGTSTSVQVSCTLTTGTCSQVCYFLDGYLMGSCPTSNPNYAFTWNTQTVVDGVHTLTAVGYAISGLTATSAPVTVTVNNSLPAISYYFNSSTGNDSYNCLSATFTSGSNGPCLTIGKFQSLANSVGLRGGDTWNFVGTGFTAASAMVVCGPFASSQCGTQNFYPSSSVLTIQGPNTCTPLSGSATVVPTNCATITRTGTGTTAGVLLWNASNVTVQNFALVGTASNTAVGGNGLDNETTNLSLLGASTNVTFNNNYASNWNNGIQTNQVCNIFQGHSCAIIGTKQGTIINFQALDNYITASHGAGTSPDGGIETGSNTQGLIQGNLTENAGGHSGDGQGVGLGNQNWPNPTGTASATPMLWQFNVTHDNGGNFGGGLGGPYSLYSIGGDNVVYQFNEEYNQVCWYGGGYPACLSSYGQVDNNGADIDQGNTNILMQYNYIHNNPMPGSSAMIFFSGPRANSNPNWAHNLYRFNIAENNSNGISINSTSGFSDAGWQNNTLASNIVTTSSNNNNTLGQGVCIGGVFGAYNNLCIMTGTSGYQWFVNGGSFPCASYTTIDYNAYYYAATGATVQWSFASAVKNTFVGYQSTCAAANGGIGIDNHGKNVNPLISGTAGTGGTCWPGGTTPPGGPQNAPSAGCPTPYQLQLSSPLIGAGVVPPTIGTFLLPTVDYYGKSLPYPSAGSPTGSGYPIGASAGP